MDTIIALLKMKSMYYLSNKIGLLIIFISVLSACSNDKENLTELCQSVPKPVEQNFDQATLVQMDNAYQELLIICQNKASLKSITANRVARLGKIYLVNNLNQKSYETLQIALQIQANQFSWIYLSGIALERLGQYTDAVLQFESAKKLRPNNIPTLIRMINILNILNEQDQVNQLINKVLNLDPEHPIALFLKAQALISEDKGVESETILKKLIKGHPYATKLNYLLSNALRLQGKVSESQSALKLAGNKSLRLKDPLVEGLQKLVTGAGAHLVLANKARKNGNLAVTQSHLLTALEFEPNNISVLHNLGYLFGVKGNHTKAIEYLSKAFKLSPNNIDLASDYATALIATNQYQEAEAVYKNILQLSPNDGEIRKKLIKLEKFINN